MSYVCSAYAGKLDELTEPIEIDEEQLEESILSYLEGWYARDREEFETEIVEQYLAADKDGKLLMVTTLVTLPKPGVTGNLENWFSICTEI